MKHIMGPPTKRDILRLTPVPRRSISPPTPPSLIVTLHVPRQPTAASLSHQPNSLHNLAVQHASIPNVDSQYRVAHSKSREDPSTEISPEGFHNKRGLSNSASASSASTTTPIPKPSAVVPEHILLDNRRKDAAAEAARIFFKWGREEIIQELNEAIQVQNNTEDSAQMELITKKIWVRESLRSRYNVYIQSYSEHSLEGHRTLRGASTAKIELGSKCEYPSCGKQFSSGEYRVSFEPLGWSVPMAKKAPSRTTVDLTSADSDDGKGEDTKPKSPEPADPVILLPDYHKLLTPRAIAEHGHGEFYCVKCFEKLLEPCDSEASATSRTSKRKRVTEMWVRPNPLCRIYSLVFAETRMSLEGGVGLDYDAYEVVRKWKDAVFDEKTRALTTKFGELILKTGKQKYNLGVKREDEELASAQVDGGRGLAECLAALKGKGTKVSRGKKKTKY